jgi:hypothetical protein
MVWLSAEKVLMAGVVLLGGYAVYRLVTAPKDQAALPGTVPGALPGSLPGAEPGAPFGTTLNVPNTAPVVKPTAAGTLRIANSCAYRGRLELSAPGTLLTPLSSPEDVVRHLESIGFDAVTVQQSPTEALAAGMPAFALGGALPSSRWFRARWLNPTKEIKPPPTLRLLIVDGRCAQQAA